MDYVARLCGDFLHITAKTLLLGRIVSARSGTGFSFQTQALYLLVFLARYLDVFTTFVSYYNTVVKLFYIATSLATVAYMWFVCRDTWEEAEKRTPNVGALLFASLAMAVAWNYQFTLLEVAWSFSIVLESVAIFPQLVVSSFAVTDPYVLAYLATLGSYRFLYIVNWVVRWRTQNYIDPIAFTFGAIQELVYLGALYAWLKRRQSPAKPPKADDVESANAQALLHQSVPAADVQSPAEKPPAYDEVATSSNNEPVGRQDGKVDSS